MTKIYFEHDGNRYILSAQGHATQEERRDGVRGRLDWSEGERRAALRPGDQPESEGRQPSDHPGPQLDSLSGVKVCAGISSILYSLAMYLTMNKNAKKIRHVMEEADVRLEYTGGLDVDTAYTMAMVGLAGIRDGYPELVEIEIFEN